MRILGWILFFSVTSVSAQQVIEPAPLSIEDDGARKIISNPNGSAIPKVEDKAQVVNPPAAVELTPPNDEILNPTTPVAPQNKKGKGAKKVATKAKPEAPAEAVGTIAPVEATTTTIINSNPQDGQLKLETKTSVKAIETAPTTSPSVVIVPNDEVTIVEVYESARNKYLQLSFGYINSRYEKIHSTLDNGSLQTAFKFMADVNSQYQAGFAVEVLSDTSGQSIPDNIRVLQYRVFVDHHRPLFAIKTSRIDWVAGLALAAGDYGIKRRYKNLQGEEVSVKIKSGTIIGLIPAAGLRVYLLGQNSLDLMVEYHQYFGNPQKYIGGLAINPRLNFVF